MGLALRNAPDADLAQVSADDLSPVTRPLDDDDLLLERIGRGEQDAFRMLVERHVDRAYALALRILRSASDAEDVAQDVLLKVWSTRGSWQPGRARFSTWLYRVVTNRCLDLHRRPRNEQIDEVPETVDGAPDAVETIHRSEVTSLLDRAMARLPEQQRIALILSYTDDLRNAEIAEIMGTTVMAVESLLKRGRQQLRALLSGAEGDIRASFTND
ncbi:MAG: RNA polymerase sigma factor [Candidatus Devosia phytovorans]|uniref:RNA polymerase sigma factor n=1 Tax=Candidatus Devosia phytovorans TaxID=3121372 RepID=A0AAJ5VR97_9HYPH|nr:RNA polymerase sigma factor [Devosia sp.]WEK03298.1 MAG: RNA polymerase sigma factor [Devosia sp.]